MQNSEGNTFYFNKVLHNAKGFVASQAHGNSFFRNDFANNSLQADVYQSYNNAWDTGFEGGYWDSYKGLDENGNGIGDVPYVLDESNLDNNPLMQFYVPGDINHDGVVNCTDADLVKEAWQSLYSEANYNPYADLNMDDMISIRDATFVGLYWQQTARSFEKD